MLWDNPARKVKKVPLPHLPIPAVQAIFVSRPKTQVNLVSSWAMVSGSSNECVHPDLAWYCAVQIQIITGL